MLNAQNIGELLEYTPFFHTQTIDGKTEITAGLIPLNLVAIYKNSFPLIFDQNIHFNYTSIPLWDLDSVVFLMGEINNHNKNLTGLSIHLYSRDFVNKPFTLKANATGTQLNDLHTNILGTFSNVKHNLRIGGNRSFTSALSENNGSRSSTWSSAERYDFNASYSYSFFSNIKMDLHTDNTYQSNWQKSNIIEGTTRVKDENTKIGNNNIYASIKSDLSKYHTIMVAGQYHHIGTRTRNFDKDLFSSKSEFSDANGQLSRTGYNFTYLTLQLNADKDAFGYTTGIDLSNTSDHIFSSINAIKTAYSDYSIFSSFRYKFKDKFRVQAGAKLLSNNLSGNFILSHISLNLKPNKLVQFKVSYNQSLAYPNFNYLFYPLEISEISNNNILLTPTTINRGIIQFNISKNKLSLIGGLQISSLLSRHRINFPMYDIKEFNSTTNSAYFIFNLKSENFTLKPSIILSGFNHFKDTINQNYFHPQFNLNGVWSIKPFKAKININGKYLGKHQSLQFISNQAYIYETDNFILFSASIFKTFIDNKLLLGFGVNNLLNAQKVTRKTYLLTEFEQIPHNDSNALISRGINSFLTLKYTINEK